MTRTLRQPGPVHPSRIDSFRDVIQIFEYPLTPGLTWNDALTQPLVAAGFKCATIMIKGVELSPFQYVMPGPANDDTHVAYFSAPSAPDGVSRIEQANATFGWSDAKPFIHCHATWIEPDGRRRGGHILPQHSVVSAGALATAWGFRDVRIDAQPDPETNFTLFQPAATRSQDGNGLVVRVKPNQDILTALETVCRRHGIRNAIVRGSLGSLIGASFTDGRRVDDHATEVLVRDGWVRDGAAAMDLLVVDMQGQVHQGWLEHGQNPVCITFDLFLEALSGR